MLVKMFSVILNDFKAGPPLDLENLLPKSAQVFRNWLQVDKYFATFVKLSHVK